MRVQSILPTWMASSCCAPFWRSIRELGVLGGNTAFFVLLFSYSTFTGNAVSPYSTPTVIQMGAHAGTQDLSL